MKKNIIIILFTLGLLLLAYFIFKSVLVYILISGVFALIARPIFIKIKNLRIKSFKLPDAASALFSILIFYGGIFIFLKMFIPSIVEEARFITELEPKSLVQSFNEPVAKLEESIAEYSDEPIEIKEYVNQKITSLINISAVSRWINIITSITGDLLISFFAISFITFFFLKDSSLILKNIFAIIPAALREEVDIILSQIKTKLTRYFIGICIEVLCIFAFNALGLWAIGVKNFLIIALFAGIINVIPYVGPLMGIIFGCTIVIITNYQLDFFNDLLPFVGYTAMVMLITQLLDNFFLQPVIYSNSVNAHPLEIFLVILIAGNLYGIVGMIIAVPTYSIVRVLIQELRRNSKFLNEIYINQ